MRYPIWWDTTLTLYNKYVDAQTQLIRWYRRVLENCFWKASGDRTAINDVVLDTSGIICRIPQSNFFLEKFEWVMLPNDEMDDYFTLAPEDIIIKGIVTDEIDEYQKGHRASDLLSKYRDLRGCMEIQEIAINTGRGRNNPHYWIRGK